MGKASPSQKARLFGIGLAILRFAAETPSPDLEGTSMLGLAQGLTQLGDIAVIDTALAQLLDDARGSLARLATMHQAVRKTRIGLPTLFLQDIEDSLDLVGIFGVRLQLARQLGTRVLPARQIPDSPGL